MPNKNDIRVYIIKSTDCIKTIREKLSICGKYIMADVMLKWDSKTNNLTETKDKNTIICDYHVMDEFKSRFPEYVVEDYDWTTFPHPKKEQKETEDLHINQIPNSFSQEDAVKYINEQLKDVIDKSQYKVSVPLHLRSEGIIYGYAKINFNSDVPQIIKYISKIQLHHKKVECPKTRRINTIQAIWHRNDNIAMKSKRIRTKEQVLPTNFDVSGLKMLSES